MAKRLNFDRQILRLIREKYGLGWTQRELATFFKTTPMTIVRVLHHEEPASYPYEHDASHQALIPCVCRGTQMIRAKHVWDDHREWLWVFVMEDGRELPPCTTSDIEAMGLVERRAYAWVNRDGIRVDGGFDASWATSLTDVEEVMLWNILALQNLTDGGMHALSTSATLP